MRSNKVISEHKLMSLKKYGRSVAADMSQVQINEKTIDKGSCTEKKA